MEVYKKIEKIINKYLEEEEEGEEEYFTGGIQEEKLQLVERTLNVNFPKSYRWFLKRYGSGGIAGTDIMGIEKDETEVERFTVVFATKTYKEKYTSMKSGYIIIEYLGDEVVCLDTHSMKNGECPVVSCLIHGIRDNEVVSENFSDYFLQQLQDTI